MKNIRLFNLLVALIFLVALVPAHSASAATSQAVPAAPYLVSPASGSLLPTTVGWQPTLKWKAVTGATSYEIQIGTSTRFSTVVYPAGGGVHNMGNVLEFQPDIDLPANSRLYWHVRAVNADGAGKWSSYRSFYTRPKPVTSGFVNGPMALDGLTVNGLRPTFEWDASENVTKYTLHISLFDNFKSIKVSKTFSVPAGTDPVVYTLTSDLAQNTLYYWRVQAVGSKAKSGFSPVQQFTTPDQPPKAPGMVSPRNVTVKVYNPDLVWYPVVPLAGHTLVYDVQLSTSSKFTTIFREYNGINATTFTIPEELVAGKYYWRVRARDDREIVSNWSASTYFKTPPTVILRVIDAAQYSLGTQEGVEGINVTWAGLPAPLVTDADGYVTVRFAPTGSRKISLSGEDFLNYSKSQSYSAGKLYEITYQIKRRPMRVQLTWDKVPSDLDVHLWLPEEFIQYHIYPDRKGSTSAVPWAKIDKDAFGTATTKTERLTIQNRFPGTYTFAVFNYSRNGSWEDSNARVVIYKLSANGQTWQQMGDPITVVKPDGKYEGKWWHVFDIDGTRGTVVGDIVINTVQIESPGPYDKFGGTADLPK